MSVKVFGPSIADIIRIEKSSPVEPILMVSSSGEITEDLGLCPLC